MNTLGKLSIVGMALLSMVVSAGVVSADTGDNEEEMDRPCFEQAMPDLSDEEKAMLDEARDLMKSGDKEGAKEIFDELGIKPGKFMGKHRGMRHKLHGQVRAALESGNYDLWVKAVGDKPIADQINEDNFDLLVEAFNLRKDGDLEGAKAIMDELGIERPEKPVEE